MNTKVEESRIYHPYTIWEDWKGGFYDNCSGEAKQEKINSAIRMFDSEQLTREYMMKVINEWKYSCEHNLTNNTINKIAYIGQAACCLYDKIPNTITMEAWSKIKKENRKRADQIALEVLNIWKNRNKKIQLCLNID